jgi:Arc/MetJ-type ribon-helix-helix transcriptional regulator
MSTISVPIPAVLEQFIEDMIADGRASNKADLVRKALMKYREDEAINAVLEAEQDIREGRVFSGDLNELSKKFSKKFSPWNS